MINSEIMLLSVLLRETAASGVVVLSYKQVKGASTILMAKRSWKISFHLKYFIMHTKVLWPWTPQAHLKIMEYMSLQVNEILLRQIEEWDRVRCSSPIRATWKKCRRHVISRERHPIGTEKGWDISFDIITWYGHPFWHCFECNSFNHIHTMMNTHSFCKWVTPCKGRERMRLFSRMTKIQ